MTPDERDHLDHEERLTRRLVTWVKRGASVPLDTVLHEADLPEDVRPSS